MTSDAIPPAAFVPHTPRGTPNAQRQQWAPVWDNRGVRWSYDPERGGYVSEDGSEIAKDVGAIPEVYHPCYAHPPQDSAGAES